MDSPTLIDSRAFVAQMRGERYGSFLIHGAPLGGKTSFAQQLATLENGVYLDVLELVAQDAALAARVDVLDEKWLENLARQQAANGAGLVVLDEWDFLLPLWGDDLAPLLQIIARLQLPARTVLLWVLSSRPELESATLPRSDGVARVLKLEQIAAL